MFSESLSLKWGGGEAWLNRSKDVFCLVGTGDYMVEITSASLYCRKVVPSDAVQLSHIQALQKTLQSILFKE